MRPPDELTAQLNRPRVADGDLLDAAADAVAAL